jgi:hypothetical protein
MRSFCWWTLRGVTLLGCGQSGSTASDGADKAGTSAGGAAAGGSGSSAAGSNGDPWLSQHHDQITQMNPNVLVLN